MVYTTSQVRTTLQTQLLQSQSHNHTRLDKLLSKQRFKPHSHILTLPYCVLQPLPDRHAPQQAPILGAPFDAVSEYTNQYPSKPISLRPVDPAYQNYRATPMVPAQTTNARVYKAWPGAYDCKSSVGSGTVRPAAAAPELLSTLASDQYLTSHASHYPPKRSSYVPQHGEFFFLGNCFQGAEMKTSFLEVEFPMA